jgi:hypothetical protein
LTGFGLRASGSGPGRPKARSLKPEAITAALCILASAGIACGRKGPPLPPFVYAPAPVGEFRAKRVGNDIILQFKVPTTNTAVPGPADLDRIEVYAHTGALPSPADFLKYGTLIGTVAVKAPTDEEQTPSAGRRAQDKGLRAEGKGQSERTVAQGDLTSVSEEMTPALLEPGKLPYEKPLVTRPVVEVVETPGTVNLPPPVMRYYVAIGISRRNRKGAFAGPLGVPISTDIPSQPVDAKIAYTQDSMSMTWSPAQGSTPRFNVYEATDPGDAGPKIRVGVPPHVPLNGTLLTEATFTDKVQFGAQKCYIVRSVTMAGAVALESEAAPPVCVTARDEFSPAAPRELTAVSDDKGVNLIWEANTEADLGGYLVLRQSGGESTFSALTPEPIKDTTYRDSSVEPGRSYAYVVIAVDTATPANRSEPSNRAEVVR